MSSDENCIDAFATTHSEGKKSEKKQDKEPEKEKKSVRKPSEEGIPKENDLAYDRNHPKYFLSDISKEVQNYLEEHVMGNPKPNPRVESPRKEVITDQMEELPKDPTDYDILEDVQNRPVNVTTCKLLKGNPSYRKYLRQLVTRRRRIVCLTLRSAKLKPVVEEHQKLKHTS